jgi:hypothetical protein
LLALKHGSGAVIVSPHHPDHVVGPCSHHRTADLLSLLLVMTT